MGQISSLFVRKVIRQVDQNVDRDGLLRSVGIEPASPTDPTLMVRDVDYYSFLESVAAVEPAATTLPLRVGATMRCDEYGAFGLAWKSAVNLQGSYRRAERYARVLTSVSSYELEMTGDGGFMHLHREGERRLGLRLSNEATIASIVAISGEVSSQDFRPRAIFFKHQAPDSLSGHEAHFGCPVNFGSDRDALLVSHESLRTPNRLGDKSISRFFDTHLDAELAKFEAETLPNQVRSRVTRSLSGGVPTVIEVARSLAMSGRTLQRRLADEGYSFQDLVDDSRRRLAKKLLHETDYSLAEIAFMTGFAEQSSFTRAFKRWAGQTPRSFRLTAMSGRDAGYA